MNGRLFQFGEELPGYSVRVLNERAVRAAAGTLFFVALVAFMNAWLVGNFQPIRVFVVAFLIDFSVRLFVNPRYAPTLIIGQWFVRRQEPEYTGAPQKRFAWGIGFALALTMLYFIVFQGVIGPINLITCAVCLTLLFFESAFGICIGCMIYNLFHKDQAELCPGGVCDYTPAAGAGGTLRQGLIVAAFLAAVVAVALVVAGGNTRTATRVAAAAGASAGGANDERCVVPAFAKALGHEQEWKLHNNCQ